MENNTIVYDIVRCGVVYEHTVSAEHRRNERPYLLENVAEADSPGSHRVEHYPAEHHHNERVQPAAK